MPALGGAAAIPLRHLDFLIHQPERSVLLYKGGVPVTVPRARRLTMRSRRRQRAAGGVAPVKYPGDKSGLHPMCGQLVSRLVSLKRPG
jgi:hypothetical protein